MQKFYCYVDEAGQHTLGKLFVVAVVFVDAEPERERIGVLLTEMEESSRKRRQKWNGSKHRERVADIRSVLDRQEFRGKCFFALNQDTTAYINLTTITIASAVSFFATEEYKSTVLVDGLRQEEYHKLAIALHKHGVRTEKVRGADDRTDAFIRLADALCGLAIDASEGNDAYLQLLEYGKTKGIIQAL